MTDVMRLALAFSFLFFHALSIGQGIQLNVDEMNISIGDEIDYGEVIATNNGDDEVHCVIALEKRCYNTTDDLEVSVFWESIMFIPTNDDYTDYGIEGIGATLAPGESASNFQLVQYQQGLFGSDWRVYFYDLYNPDDIVFLDVHIGDCQDDDVIVSIEETAPEQSSWTINPNPAQDQFRLSIQDWEEDLNLIIIDVQGKTQLDLPIQNPEMNADISSLDQGFYFAFISANGRHSKAERLIVH